MIVRIQSKRILTEAQLELLYVEGKKKRLQEGKKTETALDVFQFALDIIGLSPDPVLGTAADGINALISVARGDMLGALFSSISLIPVVGDMIGKSGKLGRYVLKLKPFIEIFRRGGKLGKIGKALNITAAAVSALATLQRALTRYASEIKKLLVSIKTGNLNDFEKITNIKFPKFARDDIEKALKKAGPTMDLDSQYKFMNFMGNLDPAQPVTEEKTVKITKTKLRQIIREELEEAHASGGGGSGSAYRRELQRYAEWAARQDEETKCQNLEAADEAGDPEARGLAQKIRCAWAAVLGGLTKGEPEEPSGALLPSRSRDQYSRREPEEPLG